VTINKQEATASLPDDVRVASQGWWRRRARICAAAMAVISRGGTHNEICIPAESQE